MFALNSALTTGETNTAIGREAGLVLTEGDSNTFVGKDGGDSATLINEAVLIGHNAGHTIDSSYSVDGTVGIGRKRAGRYGNGNLAVGYETMKTHTTGHSNIAIGHQAMDDTDAGSTSSDSDHNIAIGRNSMGGTWANAKSENNIAIGNNSLDAALNGAHYNMALGHYVHSNLTEGNSNIGIGWAVRNITTGNDNIIIGKQAGDALTTKSGMIAIGSGALVLSHQQVVIAQSLSDMVLWVVLR